MRFIQLKVVGRGWHAIILRMLNSLPIPAIFAHRGASAHAPENTMSAFELAIQQGADAIELDAQLSADRKAVVIHDHSLGRTTPAQGKVAEMSLGELTTLDAGSFFDIQFSGERIPSLEAVLERFGQRIFINIELKNELSPLNDLPQVVADLVVKYRLQRQVLISSFNPIALLRVRLREPGLWRATLAHAGHKSLLVRLFSPFIGHCQATHAHINDVTPELIAKAHLKGQRLHAYTVNQIEDLERLFGWRLDGVFSDDPALARQCLEKTMPGKTLAGNAGSRSSAGREPSDPGKSGAG